MRVLASLVACALLSASASAAKLTSFTTSQVAAIMQATGATNVTQGVDGDVPFVDFEYNKLNYRASLRLCDDGTTNNCEGLLLAIAFEAEAADTLEVVNAFNAGVPVLTSSRPDAKTLAFSRFIIATGGIEDTNVAANFGLLVAAPEIYAEFRKSQLVASNGVGGVVLLSQGAGRAPALRPARLTNEQWRRVMTVKVPKATLRR
jgi:hypothetical protein